MILKGFQTCYGHSLFFYDKVQKPKLKENQKIPVLHAAHKPIKHLLAGSKQLLSRVQGNCKAPEYLMSKSPNGFVPLCPLHYKLYQTTNPLPPPAPPPWRVFSFIFPCYFPSSSQAWCILSPSLPLHSDLSTESTGSLVYKTGCWGNVLIAKCWKTLLPKSGQWNISAKTTVMWTEWRDVWMLTIMIIKSRRAGFSLGHPGPPPFKSFSS